MQPLRPLAAAGARSFQLRSVALWRNAGVALSQAEQLGHARTPGYRDCIKPWRRTNTSMVLARPSSFRESQEQVALSERQEAFLLERLPRDWSADDIHTALRRLGIDLGDTWHERVLLMRSRLGVSLGRALVALPEHVPHITQGLPPGTTYKPMDRYDIEAFVEQCERFIRLSDDLRRLARPENFLRTITITQVPSNYGRQDVVHVIRSHCGVEVVPRDVVFRFKRWGRQADVCYVVCPSVQAADHCVAQIQELAVPKRAAYGALFGATFLWSSRATHFLCDPSLDFLLHDSKYWVFTTGWQEDMLEDEFLQVMYQMKFFPVRAIRYHILADRSSAFFIQFDKMDMTKRCMSRLRRLKHRWRMKRETPFFAYPRRVDVHRLNEDRYEDEDSGADSELEEPVQY
mmetsp:Transcript_167346/g.321448  ORF Transcript_167346/g.321448 Transcript_167346/m.321448 type:complete len:403 (-) Transcript_167346:37-1245(-)